MKASLIKTMEEGEDMDLALLTYKTTPLSHRLSLPAELLNSRKYKTLLPTQIVQQDSKKVRDISWTKENRYRHSCTTRTTRVLPRLEQSKKVVVQLDPSKNIWILAEIIQCPTPSGRSYGPKAMNSGVYTRNRRFIGPDLTAA